MTTCSVSYKAECVLQLTGSINCQENWQLLKPCKLNALLANLLLSPPGPIWQAAQHLCSSRAGPAIPDASPATGIGRGASSSSSCWCVSPCGPSLPYCISRPVRPAECHRPWSGWGWVKTAICWRQQQCRQPCRGHEAQCWRCWQQQTRPYYKGVDG